MSDLLNRLRKAARAAQAEEESGRFEAAGKKVVCPHCGEDRFDEGKVLPDSTVLTLKDLESADRRVTILICRRCGRIEWFSSKSDRQ